MLDLRGKTTTLRALVRVVAGVDAVVGGNSGPPHLAAVVGTPRVAVFPPTVAIERWRPCAGRRSRARPASVAVS